MSLIIAKKFSGNYSIFSGTYDIFSGTYGIWEHVAHV